MNIIFGDSVKTIPDHYIVLELDTFRQSGNSNTITAYYLVEKLDMNEFPTMEAYKNIHADVIKYYKLRKWHYCEQAIEGLIGRWAGDLDTFYTNLLERVKTYKESEPPEDWDGVLLKD